MKANIDLPVARLVTLLSAACFLLGACTMMPIAPSVTALPGSRKSVNEYQADVVACQQYAGTAIAGSDTAAAADNSAASTAAAGAVFGAALGAIIGSATGQAGQGAAIGAGTGLLFGGMAGSNYTAMSSYQLQRSYDAAYLQCMYGRGNRVPVPRGYGAPRGVVYPFLKPGPSRYPPPNMPPPPGATNINPPPSSAPPSGYPPPPNAPPSSYPPPDTPPPIGLPPRS
jgi:hypothetical protein